MNLTIEIRRKSIRETVNWDQLTLILLSLTSMQWVKSNVSTVLLRYVATASSNSLWALLWGEGESSILLICSFLVDNWVPVALNANWNDKLLIKINITVNANNYFHYYDYRFILYYIFITVKENVNTHNYHREENFRLKLRSIL